MFKLFVQLFVFNNLFYSKFKKIQFFLDISLFWVRASGRFRTSFFHDPIPKFDALTLKFNLMKGELHQVGYKTIRPRTIRPKKWKNKIEKTYPNLTILT